LEYTPFDQAAPQIMQALQCRDRDVRLRAVNLLVIFKDNAGILPLIALAQRDIDPEVRRNALVALQNSGLKASLTPYLLTGALDNDEDVRATVVQTVWSLSPEQRDEFIGQAVNSSHPDVSSAAFDMLQHEYSKKTVDLLVNIYATNNFTQIQKANKVMNTLLQQTFDSAADASAWWQQHQADYQDDLSLKTGALTENP
jgi:HEAT repeat protein